MSAELSREETEALLSPDADPGAAREAQVASRDFARPLRLSRAERQRLARAVGAALPELETRLSTWVRGETSLGLEQVDEIGAPGLFDGLGEPFLVQRLLVGGHQGWLVCPNEAGQALAERALGAPLVAGDRAPRPLSAIEAGVLGDLLEELAAGIAGALNLVPEYGPLLQSRRALELDLDADLAREPRRVALYVALSGPALPSTTLRLYLPGILPTQRQSGAPRRPRPLPAHLGSVPIEISAELGSIEVPLSELLSLEVGDVVPLGATLGEAAVLRVEERPCGRALWGSHQGGLALRILNFQPPEED